MVKRTRAKAEAHGEKKKRKNFMLTPTAEQELDRRAAALGVSISEYLDRYARNLLPEVLYVSAEERSTLGESSRQPLPSGSG